MFRGVFQRYLKREEGATIIEYAIVAPILFLMVMGIIEFALLVYAQSVLDSATTQAARFGTTGSAYEGEFVNPIDSLGVAETTGGRDAFVEAHIRNRASGLLNESNIVIDPSDFGGCGESRLYEVSYRWQFFTPFVGDFFTSQSCGGAGTSGEAGVYNICSSAFVTNESCD